MARYEYRSRDVRECDNEFLGCYRAVEKTCNAWAAEGFVVFSVICPNPSNYSVFRLTARRDLEQGVTPKMFQETL